MRRSRLSHRTKSALGVMALISVFGTLSFVTFTVLRGYMYSFSHMIDVLILTNELTNLAGQVTEGLPADIEQYSLHPDLDRKTQILSIYQRTRNHLAQLDRAIWS